MALDKGIWGPEPKVTNIKGTNLNCLITGTPPIICLLRIHPKVPKGNLICPQLSTRCVFPSTDNLLHRKDVIATASITTITSTATYVYCFSGILTTVPIKTAMLKLLFLLL